MSLSSLQSCLLSSAADLPMFVINADQIRILHTPQDLYNNLLERIRTAQRRIVLSTLYIGTGELELQLVDAIKEAVCERKVQVLLLLDASRGLRCASLTHQYAGVNQTGSHNSSFRSSCELLAPLTKLDGVTVVLYHNPHLRGWLYSFLPDRCNEVLGVQHIKAYVVDDSVLVSGANLSHEYFTARQDRAWIFQRCSTLSDFYSGLIETISKFCYQLQPKGTLTTAAGTDPMRAPLAKFKEDFHSAISGYLERTRRLQPAHDLPNADTLVLPLVQCGPYGVRVEEKFTVRLLEAIAADQHNAYSVFLASGYFNLTKCYENLLVDFAQTSQQSGLELLCASPLANGFLQSRGLSGFIPMAYRESFIRLASRFSVLKNLENAVQPVLMEYYRPRWTFHAKGLWMEEKPNTPLPSSPSSVLSFIGSSNFSCRSLNRDLESQLVVWTKNAELRTRIVDERNQLFCTNNCHLVTLPKLLSQAQFRLPWYLRFLYPLLHTYL